MATTNHGWTEPSFPSDTWQDTFEQDLVPEIDTDVIMRGTESNRPAAGTQGRIYLAHDTETIFYDDGSSWQEINPTSSGVDLGDDENLFFGNDNDYGIRYDSTDDQLTVSDAINSVDLMDFNRNGGVNVLNGTLSEQGNRVATRFWSQNNNIDHAELGTITSDDHHTRYTDEEAQDATGAMAGNALTYTDSTPSLDVDETAISHTNLANTTSDDHHTRYSDSEAITAAETGLTMTGNIDLQTTYEIINAPAPNDPNDLARKAYVDSVAQGLELKDSVRATSVNNVNLGSTTDPNPIDGVTLNDGDRVLLKEQSDGTENGIYIAATATDPTTWYRAPDMDEDSEAVSGSFTFTEAGTNNGDTSWIITTDDPITLGSTVIVWSQFASAGDYEAGDGLTLSSKTFNIEPTDFAGAGLQDDGSNDLELTNDSVTVASNTVALGGSTAVDHADLSNIGSSDHHSRYTDEEAQDAVGTILGTHMTYDDATPQIYISDDTVTVAGNSVALGGSTAVDHADLSNIGSSDHHVKTTDMSDMNDITGITSFEENTAANQPAAGTEGRIFFVSDEGTVEYDNGTSWVNLGVSDHSQLSGIGSSDHHTRYTDEEAQDAVGNILGANFTYDDAGNTITLTSDTVTVAGNSVALGGSTAVDHADLSNIGSADHHSRYTDEESQDATNNLLVGGTNVTLTYDDAGNSLTIDASDTDTRTDVSNNGSLLVSDVTDINFGSNLDASSDGDGTVTITGSSSYTDEDAQDAVGNILGSNFNYDDANDSITLVSDTVTVAGNSVSLGGSTSVGHADLSNIGSSDHHVKTTDMSDMNDITGITSFEEDIASNQPAAGTEGRIFFVSDTGLVQYDDGTSWLNLGVSDHSQLSGVGSADHHTRYTDEEAQDATGSMAGNALTYTDSTPSLDVDESAISHDNLSGVSSGDHHTRYSDEEAQDAVGTILGTHMAYSDSTPSITISDDTVTVAGNSVTLGGSTAVDHADLSNIGSSDHHVKTTDMDDMTDITGITSFEENTVANQPAAGTEGRIFFVSDEGTVEYDNGTSWVNLGVSDHSQLSGVGSADHHSRYTDEEAQDATGAMAGNALTYSDSTPSLDVDESAISHDNISGVSSSDHHVKTTDMSDMNDIVGITSFEENTAANQPAAGTEGRIFFVSDQGTVEYDDGTSWINLGVSDHSQLSGVGSADHHSRYTDEEAQDAVNSALNAGTNLSKTYDDANDTITLNGATDPLFEQVRFDDLDGDGVLWTLKEDNSDGYFRIESGGADVIKIRNSGTIDMTGGGDIILGNDLTANNGEVIWDESNTYIPQARLQNDTVTVAGNSVSLGGSTAISHADLSNISSNDHHSRYTDEEAQDAVGTIMSGGTDITVTYDDAGNTITVDHNDTSTQGNVSAAAGAAVTDVNLDGRGHVTSLGTTDFDGRYIQEGGDTISGNLTLDDDVKIVFGTNADFAQFYDSSTDEFVIYDESNNVELIRQPKSGPTEFLQGARIGFIESPEDSLTTGINASITSSATSGTTVGYTFEVDSVTALQVSGTADGAGGLSSGPNVLDQAGNIVYDNSNNWVPQARLENDTVTVAGNSVALGGSTAISHADLSNISSNDHHSRYADEEAQDAVGTILGANFTYDDAGNTITLTSDTVTVAGNSVALGGSTAISHADLSNISSNDHHSRYTDEEAQDATGAMAGNALTYTDSTPSLDVDESAISHDNIGGVSSSDHHVKTTDMNDMSDITGITSFEENTAANQPAAGTEGRIFFVSDQGTVEYDNGTSWVNLGVSDHSQLSGIGSSDHHTRYSNEEAQDAVGTILGTHMTYDDATPQIYISDDTVTVAGNSVTLGGSTAISHADLSNISSNDHHSRYTDEESQDATNNLLVGGTNVSLTYDDAGNSLTIDATDTDTRTDVSDNGSLVVSDVTDINFSSNLDVTDDGDGTISVSGSAAYTDEDAQDAVGTIMSGGTDIGVTYDDANNTITVDHSDTSTQGNVSAAAGAAVTDVNLDGRGHVTSLGTTDFDGRYLLESGDTVGGNLGFADDVKLLFGSNGDFGQFYDSSTDELVITDETNGVELIRQPKSGPIEFLQGARIGYVESPEDSLTTGINAAITSSATSGTEVGYTFEVDSVTAFTVSGTADGSGGLSSGPNLKDLSGLTFADSASTGNSWSITEDASSGHLEFRLGGTSQMNIGDTGNVTIETGGLTVDADTSLLQVWDDTGTRRAELDNSGNLTLEGTLTEGAAL